MTSQTPMGNWYYPRDKKKVGPVSLARLRVLLAEGVLKPEAMVFQEGAQKWCRLGEVIGAETRTARTGGLWKLAVGGGVGLVMLALLGWGLLAMMHGSNG